MTFLEGQNLAAMSASSFGSVVSLRGRSATPCEMEQLAQELGQVVGASPMQQPFGVVFTNGQKQVWIDYDRQPDCGPNTEVLVTFAEVLVTFVSNDLFTKQETKAVLDVLTKIWPHAQVFNARLNHYNLFDARRAVKT